MTTIRQRSIIFTTLGLAASFLKLLTTDLAYHSRDSSLKREGRETYREKEGGRGWEGVGGQQEDRERKTVLHTGFLFSMLKCPQVLTNLFGQRPAYRLMGVSSTAVYCSRYLHDSRQLTSTAYHHSVICMWRTWPKSLRTIRE